MTKTEALRAAVIGCGPGGRLSLAALHASRRYELVAAADPATSARREVESTYPGLALFDDYGDMPGGLDVVSVATPAPLHEPIARSVMTGNVRGLLLEKPIACSADVAAALLADIKARKLPVVVPHGMLVLPAAKAVRRLIRSRVIGSVTAVDVQNAVDLLNGGIHWLAFLLDLFQDDAPISVDSSFDVSGRTLSDGVQVESAGRTCITTQSGCQWTLLSGVATTPFSEVLPADEQIGALFRITGSKGLIEFSAWSGSYRLIGANTPEAGLVQCASETDAGYHQLFLDQLAASIAAGRPDYRSAGLSLAALRLIETAYRSHDDAGWQLGQPASQE